MKRIVLVVAAALLVGVACTPIKPPSGIPGRDIYITEANVQTASAGGLTIEVHCQLSYIHGNAPAVHSPLVYSGVGTGSYWYDWRDQDITNCTAIETSGKPVLYGTPSVHGASTTELHSTPQTCWYYEGGKGNAQTCYFWIQDA
jgi:hypothetical protein